MTSPRGPMAVACAGAFVAALSTSLVAVSAPVIARDLGVSASDVSWVLTAYLLAVSCLLALAGKATDLFGQKRVLLVGFGCFVAGSAICASAGALQALIGGRVLQGVGSAMLMAVGPALVTRSVEPSRRARALGVQLAATYIGLTLGPGAGGLLSARIGWHAVFVVIASAGAAAGLVALVLLPRDKPRKEDVGLSSLDLGGAVLLGVGLAALLVAVKRVQDSGFQTSLALAGFGLATLGVFVRHEAVRRSSPLLALALFRKPAFALGILGATMLYTVTFMLAWLLPFYLQRTAGLGALDAGAFMTAQPAAMAVVAPISGSIADRWGPRIPSVAGMLAIAAGLVGVSRVALHHDARLVAALGLVGVGAGLFVAPNSALIMGAAPRERQGMAAAMAATARTVGMTAGIALAASLERGFGFGATLLVAAGLAVVGAVLGVVRPSSTSDLRRP